jgi:hypothetical protein
MPLVRWTPIRVLAAIHRMKTWLRVYLRIVLLVVSLVGCVHETFGDSAYPLTLQWQASADPVVTGYALYYGVDGSPITNRMNVGSAMSALVKNLTASSTYSFYVVAYDADQNESAPSNLLLYTASTISPVRLSQPTAGTMNISFYVAPGASCHVEYTGSLNPPMWNLLTTAVADSNGLVTINDPVNSSGSRFYRAVAP